MRFHGEIGYGESKEKPAGSGIWVDEIVEFPYFGDVVRNSRRLEAGEGLNSDISLGNSVSIVADQYADEHFDAIRYVIWNGTKWTVSVVEVRPPRLLLTLGAVYNGEVP